jgi:hypothetical protein
MHTTFNKNLKKNYLLSKVRASKIDDTVSAHTAKLQSIATIDGGWGTRKCLWNERKDIG